MSVPAPVVLGIPMYTNAAGVIAIVEAPLGRGAAIGTVLAFMMSVIALSLPEMIILRKVLTFRLIGVFIAVVGFGIVSVGYLFNALFWERQRREEIKLYGPGCKRCAGAEALIRQRADESGVEIEIEKVTDLAPIAIAGVVSTPGIAVDGTLLRASGLPRRADVDRGLQN